MMLIYAIAIGLGVVGVVGIGIFLWVISGKAPKWLVDDDPRETGARIVADESDVE